MKILFALIIFFFTFSAWAKTDQEIRDSVESALMEYHFSDNASWWQSLGPKAPHVIIEMYQNTSPMNQRIRLLQGLAWFDDPEAIQFVKEQAKETSQDILRNAAIRSIGASQGAKEIDFLSQFLQNEDPQTRLAAAQTLQKISDPRAQAKLDQYRTQERTPWILDRLKGEYAKPTAPLIPVASSEDRLNSALAGTWKGCWIVPKKGESELLRETAQLKLRLPEAGGIEGELVLKGRQAFVIGSGAGKANHFSGNWIPSKGESIPFEGDLSQEVGSGILRIRMPVLGGSVILIKSLSSATPS